MRKKPELEGDDILTTPLGFVEGVLGLPLYDWQARAVIPLELATGPNAKRINIAVRTPNGAGKDDRIIAGAAHWWLSLHKRGKVVITTKSDLQLTQQTIPAIERHRKKFGGYQSISSPRYELTTPSGGKCIAFVTNNAARVEGWHKEDNIDGPLLLIINEGKSYDEELYAGFDRCTPNAVMVLSSPGPKVGRFYDLFTKLSEDWIQVVAGLADCPHIPQERIDYVIATYGEDHPVTRSTLFGEFMEQEDEDQFAVSVTNLEKAINNPPRHRPGFKAGFCDFGAGKAEHVFGTRDGNKLDIAAAWVSKDKEASAGRFIREFRKAGFSPNDAERIRGDSADKEMCDLIEDAGWAITRVPFGGPAQQDGIYKSWSAEAWIEMGIALGKCEWIIPDNDPILRAQLTTRKKDITPNGKLCVEDKYEMVKRGIKSPDRGDVICGLGNIENWEALYAKQPFRIPSGAITERGLEEFSDHSEILDQIGASAGL